MKQIFRRKKPPLKVFNKGEQRPKPVLKSTIPVAKPGDTWKELEPLVLLCPLCRKPLSEENIHHVLFNGQIQVVHNVCPEGNITQ